jgi:hypothetical protein
MRIKSKSIGWAAVGLAILLAVGSMDAQSGPPPGPPPGSPAGRGMPFGDIGFGGFEAGFGGKTVTNAPFTATFSTQTSQALSDGNQIQRTTAGTIARDSAGRTRRDLTLSAIGPWAASGNAAPHVVIINDPVANVQYILETNQKIARKVSPSPANWRGPNGATQANGTQKTPKDETTVDLGTQFVAGVNAQGTRTTRTIPAGAIGNTQPLTITTERWLSPDLQTVVLTKRTDPRTGSALFQLTNIIRQEPDPTLFQVPSDYTVQDSRGGGPVGRPGGGGPREHRPPAAANGSGAAAPQN